MLEIRWNPCVEITMDGVLLFSLSSRVEASRMIAIGSLGFLESRNLDFSP